MCLFQLFSQLCFLALAPYLNPNRASRGGYTQFNDYGHQGGSHRPHGGGGRPHQQHHHVTPYAAAGGTNHGLGDAYGEHYPEHEPAQVYYPDSGHPLISGHPDYAGIKKKGEGVKDLDHKGPDSIRLIMVPKFVVSYT